MQIRVLIEFQAKPGMRATLLQALDAHVAAHGQDVVGYLGSTRYAPIDQPDHLVEIAEWESVQAHRDHVSKALAAGTFAPILELTAEPLKVTVLQPLE